MTPTSFAPAPDARSGAILSSAATALVVDLQRQFGQRRVELLADRVSRRRSPRRLSDLDFLPETEHIRAQAWTVAQPRPDFLDRRVEITGPPDGKMIINALNSGARGFMVDFEDSLSPTWAKVLEGQQNVLEAVRGTLTHASSDGRLYTLDEERATLVFRPRGWHLLERHVLVGDAPASASLFDFGLFAFHCAAEQLRRGTAPYLYLPKMEHHLEARLWNDVLSYTEEALNLPHGSFRATVLIETLPAAFQMEEILWELRDHSYGLNAGRWDYIFSAIKSGRDDPAAVLPDRAEVTMAVPFMSAYAQRLVDVCHRRGTFAMGGMSALVPSRGDEAATARAIEAVRNDKRREATLGFDGTWVAHPGVVSAAMAEFDAVLGDAPNQIAEPRESVAVTANDLRDLGSTPGAITEAGIRNNLSVAFQYLSFWLCGRGAAAINAAMEDAATAEISRAQLWHWMRHQATMDDGRTVTAALVTQLLEEEVALLRTRVGDDTWEAGRPDDSRRLLDTFLFSDDLEDFLTLRAYELLA